MKIQIAKIPTLSLSELPLLSEANIFQNDPVVWLHYNISPTSNSLKSGVILRSGQKKTIQNIIAPLFSGKDTSPSPKKKSTKNGRTPPSLDVWIAPRNSRPLEVLLRCQYSLFGAKRGRKRGRKQRKLTRGLMGWVSSVSFGIRVFFLRRALRRKMPNTKS